MVKGFSVVLVLFVRDLDSNWVALMFLSSDNFTFKYELKFNSVNHTLHFFEIVFKSIFATSKLYTCSIRQ